MITPAAHVAKDCSITWRVLFRIDGRKTTQTFKAQKGAEQFARLIDQLGPVAALEVLDQREAAGNVPTVSEWATHHIDNISGAQPGTLRTYRGIVRRDLGSLAHLPITAITEDTIVRWVNAMAKGGASGKTIKNKHGFVSAAFNRAVRDRLITHNPCKGTRLPRTETVEMVFLTHDEYARFLGYVPAYWQPFVTTLFSTGLRWGELTALRIGDVDLERATITVVRAWKMTAGEGHALGAPKSAKGRRTIALAPETVDLLRPLVTGRSGAAWLFVNTQGGPLRAQSFHSNVWQPTVRLANGEPARAEKNGKPGQRVTKRRVGAAGAIIAPATVPLGKRPRIHDARHSCASWLLGAGVPINYVQAHLGHESITTTVDRYGKVMPAAHNAIAGAMSQALSQAHPTIEPPDDEPRQIGA